MAKDRSKKILKEIASLRAEITARLDRLEAGLGDRSPRTEPSLPPLPVEGAVPGSAVPTAEAGVPVGLPAPADGEIRVIVRPLRDLSLARAVESSLAESDGVERATLRELRGDSATIDVRATDDFSVVGTLRRRLPVAFDVTDSDDRSVTIALAQPQAGSAGGVVAPGGS
ncbi:MAG: hypothetical protein M9938_02490 [Solirubrobacterales bacterium]|nr:hypothetical protein [Solirubrobacterales bacterium]